MDLSTVFKKDMAGKYAGLPGFSAGISLGENLTTPLSQQASGMSGSSFNPVDYYKSLEGLPEGARTSLLLQEINNRSGTETADLSFLKKIYEDQSDPVKRQQILDQQLKYDEQRMRAAAPYKFAFDLPKQIAEGFGSQAALNVLGARSAVDAMNQTLQAYPKMSFQTSAFTPQRYLS
jgi:hypothetical protein